MATATSRTPYGSRPEPKSRDGHEPQQSRSFPTYRFTAGLTNKAAQDCPAGATR
jgi:hypothetical protein